MTWSDARLILTARESSLDRFDRAGIVEDQQLWIRTLDIRDDQQRRAVVAETEAKLGGIDILINNAGIAYRGAIEHIGPAENLDQMMTNYVGPIALARLVLPAMRRKGAGRIINISSVSGMMAMPTMGAYSASKFALEGATESLWYEMRPWNVCVTLAQPGFIHSSSFRNVILTRQASESLQSEDDPYHAMSSHMGPFIERLMNLARATPDHIATRVLQTLASPSPRLRTFATVDARLFYILRRALPRRVFHALLYHALPGIRRWGPQA